MENVKENTVSLCIIAYNEENVLDHLFGDILAQSFDKKRTELVFVDSLSTDNTKNKFMSFREKYEKDYLSVRIADNPGKIQSYGWNTAIMTAKGDIIIRLDAHASIPPDFIEKNVSLINEGEYVCGGARPNNIDEPTPYREMLLAAESSMFGSSIAGYRRKGGGKRYVNSLFHGAYRREVFAKVGGFDISLGRTEDNELHYRIRQNGFKICQSDDIISYQNIRPDLSGMLGQKYGNGKWIGLTLSECPGCLSYFHFAPFLFVMMLVACTVLAFYGTSLPLLVLLVLYAMFDFVNSVSCCTLKNMQPQFALLPFIFPLLHVAYGIGTIVGLAEIPFWQKKIKSSDYQARIDEVKRKVAENTEKRWNNTTL